MNYTYIFALVLLIIVLIVLLWVHLRYSLTLKLILIAIAIGVLSSFAGNQVNQMGINLDIINKSDPLFNFAYAFFATGLSMQLLQFLFLNILIYPSKEFNTPVFGLMHCVWISIGAIILEIFIIDYSTFPMIAICNILGHISTAIVLGYFISMAKFSMNPTENFTYLNSGLASAIIIQGLHEFFILERQIPNLIVLLLGTAFLGLILTAHLFRQENQVNKEKSTLEDSYPEDYN